MSFYPKLNKKLGLIGACCLLVWGAFILGMQVYVFSYYSQVHGEDNLGIRNPVWGNSYNGVALANAGACLLFGLFYSSLFTEKNTKSSMLLWAIILAVLGAGLAIASLVLTALEADWLNVSVNIESTHPCKGSTNETKPSELDCTNWLALEITVSVLSGLAFGEYIFIGCIVFLGLTGGKHDHDNRSIDSQPTNLQQTPVVKLNPNNLVNKPSVYEQPYNAYNPPQSYNPPPQQQQQRPIPQARTTPSNLYEEHNPQYSHHLQQLELQQALQRQNQQQQQQQQYPMPQQQRISPVGQRGNLQSLHNQRQRAPAPPVPAKPQQSSSLYRF